MKDNSQTVPSADAIPILINVWYILKISSDWNEILECDQDIDVHVIFAATARTYWFRDP